MVDFTIEQRLVRLERQNRRLKFGMLVGLAAVAALVCIAATQPAPKTVRAGRFEVVDTKGKVRGLLTLGDGVGPKLLLYDKDGNARAVLGLTPNGNPELCLYDRGGSGGVGLMVGDDVNPMLTLRDKQGELRAGLSGTELELRDVEGHSRLALTLGPGGNPTMGLFRQDGEVVWKVP